MSDPTETESTKPEQAVDDVPADSTGTTDPLAPDFEDEDPLGAGPETALCW